MKSGHVDSSTICELTGTMEREQAEMGLLVTLEDPSRPMLTEALEAGYYRSDVMGRDYPRVQIVTVRELFEGKGPQLPLLYSPYRLAERQSRPAGRQAELFGSDGQPRSAAMETGS